MSNIQQLLAFNESFVKNKGYESLKTTKYPDKKVVILSCMDSRLIELLPASLNLKNGDAIFIKNAGAVISHPFGSVMRSILVAVYDLGAEEIMVIAHTDCGMQQVDSQRFITNMKKRNIAEEKIEQLQYFGINLHKWLAGFENVEQTAMKTADTIRNHPPLPGDVDIRSFVMDSETGQLTEV